MSAAACSAAARARVAATSRSASASGGGEALALLALDAGLGGLLADLGGDRRGGELRGGLLVDGGALPVSSGALGGQRGGGLLGLHLGHALAGRGVAAGGGLGLLQLALGGERVVAGDRACHLLDLAGERAEQALSCVVCGAGHACLQRSMSASPDPCPCLPRC